MSLLRFFSKSDVAGKLNASSSKISSAITQLFTHKKIDETTVEELEEALIESDVGTSVAALLTQKLRQQKFEKNIDVIEVKKFLAAEIEKILQPCEAALNLDETHKPQVVIFNGVNGVGKTTTIGKVAAQLKSQNKKVLIAACDTFRSAAVEQLQVWANRTNCEIMTPQKEGEDPAAIAFRALNFAKENGFDIVLIDTAGRLQNKQNLMDELKKINQVLKKIDASAPHENLLILDATTGQNARNQLEIFNNIVGISGLVITKLDGTARGGIVVALAQQFNKKIYAIGVGEKVADLQEFSAANFAKNLLDL
jgi:fused signal recognition particle receptor